FKNVLNIRASNYFRPPSQCEIKELEMKVKTIMNEEENKMECNSLMEKISKKGSQKKLKPIKPLNKNQKDSKNDEVKSTLSKKRTNNRLLYHIKQARALS